MLICMDTETTGLDPTKNEIIQQAIVYMDDKNRRILSELNMFIRPDRPEIFHPEAQKTTGINTEDLKDSRFMDKREAMAKLKQWLSYIPREIDLKSVPLLGSNIQYDIDMVKAFFTELGEDYPFSHRKLDTTTIGLYMSAVENGYVASKPCGLGFLADKYGIYFKHHDAYEDVQATIRVYYKMLDSIKSSTMIEED